MFTPGRLGRSGLGPYNISLGLDIVHWRPEGTLQQNQNPQRDRGFKTCGAVALNHEVAAWRWRMNFSMAFAKPSSSLEVVT